MINDPAVPAPNHSPPRRVARKSAGQATRTRLCLSPDLVQGIAGTAVISTVPNLQSWPFLQWTAVAVVSLVIADVLYRTVEQPMIGVGRRLLDWMRARSAAKRTPEVVEQPREVATANA